MNIGSYLFEEIDENICLYNGYVISNTHMNDDLLKEINLKEPCKTKPEDCYNVLRFTDIENSTKLYVDTDDFLGFDNRVTCKL